MARLLDDAGLQLTDQELALVVRHRRGSLYVDQTMALVRLLKEGAIKVRVPCGRAVGKYEEIS